MNGLRRPLSVKYLVLFACFAACLSPVAATADSAPIPNDGSLPWTDPNHQNPLEVLAGQIASKIAGRPVGVRCEGTNDWQKLSQENGTDTDGFVRATWHWNGSLWSPTTEGFAQLSPEVCQALRRFALATTKPTKCAATITATKTVLQKVTVTKKVRRKVNGKWVTRIVKSIRVVPRKVTTQVQGPTGPCYLGANRFAASMPDSFWSDYGDYSYAILMLAHEASHLGGDLGIVIPADYPGAGQVGYADDEARAECHGMQWTAYAAEQLGDTPDDAKAIARYDFDNIYPKYTAKHPEYGSPDCRENGPLDLSPGDGRWP